MFKRVSLWMLCLALVIGLTACGGGETSSTPSSDPGSTTPADGEKEWMNGLNFGGRKFIIGLGGDWGPKAGESEGSDRQLALIEEIQSKYNCTIEYQAMPSIEGQLQATALAGTYLADVCYAQSYNLIPGYAKAGLVHAVSDFDVFDFSEPKWNTGMIDYCTYRGKVYAFPEGYTDLGAGVFFNKDLFEANSLQSPYELYESDSWTWQAMVDYATALTQDTDGDGENDQWGLAIDSDYYPFLFSNNVHMLEYQNDKYTYTLNSPAAVEALEFFIEQSNSDINAPWLGDNLSSRVTPFVEGRIGMLVANVSHASTYFGDMSDDYGWVPFPKGPSADTYQLYRASTSCYIVPTPVQNPEQVFQMYDLITDWVQEVDALALYKSPLLCDDESLEILRDAYDGAWNDYDMSNMVAGFKALTRSGIDAAWGGDVAVKTAVDSVADAAQQLIDESLNAA